MENKELVDTLKTLEKYIDEYPVSNINYRMVTGQLEQVCLVLDTVIEAVKNDTGAIPPSEVSPVLVFYDETRIDEPNATPVVVSPDLVEPFEPQEPEQGSEN